jgi:hypothetical protein
MIHLLNLLGLYRRIRGLAIISLLITPLLRLWGLGPPP